MTIDFSNRVMVPPHVLVRQFENESVLLNLTTESYHGFDEIGTQMWSTLTRAATIQAAFEELLGEFEVEPDILRRDLEHFIRELQERGLLEIHNA